MLLCMAHSLTLGMSHHHLYLLLVLTIHSGWASQVVLLVKDLPANAGDVREAALISGLGRSPQRRAWQPTPVFLPGESYGQRSLAGYSPWSHKELDMTEVTYHIHITCCFAEIKNSSFGIFDSSECGSLCHIYFSFIFSWAT